jgi:hypothetical protein
MGGFYNSLFFVGLIIYSQFQGTLFFSGIISKLYLVEDPPGERKKVKIEHYEPSQRGQNFSEEAYGGRRKRDRNSSRSAAAENEDSKRGQHKSSKESIIDELKVLKKGTANT